MHITGQFVCEQTLKNKKKNYTLILNHLQMAK